MCEKFNCVDRSPEFCEKYQTISLIPHISKVMPKIIYDLIYFLTHTQISIEQASFTKGRGTRKQILNLETTRWKTREYNILAMLCFIDFKKAFDSVHWPKMWSILLDMGAPLHFIGYMKKPRQKYALTTTGISITLSEVFDTVVSSHHYFLTYTVNA